MDLVTLLTHLDKRELARHLNIEDLIGLYFTCKDIRHLLEEGAPHFSSFYQLPLVSTFASFVLEMDRNRSTYRTYKYIGLNSSLKRAALEGNLGVVQDVIGRGANHYEQGLKDAAQSGHLHVIEHILTIGGSLDDILETAARYGHLNIVNHVLNSYKLIRSDKLILTVRAAAKNGHLHIFKALFPKVKIDVRRLIADIVCHGHLSTFESFSMATSSRVRTIQYPLRDHITVNDRLVDASFRGCMAIVTDMLSKGANVYSKSLHRAAAGGHIDIVKLMLSKGAISTDKALSSAAKGGHLDIILLLLGYDPLGGILEVAVQYGHCHIIRHYAETLSIMSNTYNRCVRTAIQWCRIDAIKLLLAIRHMDVAGLLPVKSIGDSNFSYTCRMGNLEVIRLLLDHTREHIDGGLEGAAHGGHIDIVKIMLDLGATDYNHALHSASCEGHIEIVRMMLDLGATNLNEALEAAQDNDHDDIADLLMDNGAALSSGGNSDSDFEEYLDGPWY